MEQGKNMLCFWDLLAHACGLVAWYKKSFSHGLTFKHTLKSHWNQRALEVRLKLSIHAMLCCERAMCLGRYLVLHKTWIRGTKFRWVFEDYFVKHAFHIHVKGIICKTHINICSKNKTSSFQWKLLDSKTILQISS